MRILLDQGLPIRAAEFLRSKGGDAVHTEEAGLARAADPAILEWCRSEDRVLFSLDRDFHRLIALASASGPSVVRLRLQGLSYRETAEIIEQVIATHRNDLDEGALISVRGHSIKVRKLPISSVED